VIVSTAWARKWNTYIEFPNEKEPGPIDNSDLICEHGKFICYNDITDIDRPYCLVRDRDYRELTSKFPCNAEIKVDLLKDYTTSYVPKFTKSTPETCKECSENMKRVMEIDASTFVDKSLHIIEKTQYSSMTKDTYITTCSHTMTVGELKLHIYQVWEILPYEQLLTYGQIELLDDTRTLGEYTVTPLMPIIVTKVKEYDQYSHLSGQPTARERGFEGTIFMQSSKDKNTDEKK